MKKGKEKRRKITLKGGKCIFLDYELPPAANLFVGDKNESKKRGGGNYQNAQYISLWSLFLTVQRHILTLY